LEQRRRDERADLLTPSAGESGRAIVIEPSLKHAAARGAPVRAAADTRTPEARLAEAVGLAGAINLNVVQAGLVTLNNIRPATYLGTGKVDEIAGLTKSLSASVVIMDCPISPVQQKKSGKGLGAKVIDRTGLILEIFGRRARTKEGALQVEHAHLTYQKTRLVRAWTHLERQRGGFGFLGGPAKPSWKPTAASSRSASPRSKANSTRSSAPANCIATAASACHIRSWRWSATPMPASRRCSTA